MNISEQDQLEKALEEAKIGVSTREANSAEDENSNLKNEESKHQKRGGKGLARDEEKRILREDERRKKAKVTITLVDRNRRKSVTHVNGVDSFGLDLKTVAKRLAGKYACGCSVVKSPAGEDEIVIQGDVVDDLIAFLSGEWSEISPDQIVYKPKPQKKK